MSVNLKLGYAREMSIKRPACLNCFEMNKILVFVYVKFEKYF